MSFTVLIPARMASSRLPDKPLADIAGLPMVVRVAQRAQHCSAQRVVVAADDARIVNACQNHGIEVVLTRTDHPSGSDRLAQACDLLQLQDDEVVVNVQGDEPLIDPAAIDAAADLLHTRNDCSMPTPTWSKWCSMHVRLRCTSAAPPLLGGVMGSPKASPPCPALRPCGTSVCMVTAWAFCAAFPR